MWYLHYLWNWGSAGRRYSVLSRRAIWLQYKWKEEGRFLDIDRRIEKTLNIVGEEVGSEFDMGCCIVGIDYPIRRIRFWLWQIQKLHIWKTHKTDLKWWGKRSEWIRRRNSGGKLKRTEEVGGTVWTWYQSWDLCNGIGISQKQLWDSMSEWVSECMSE